MESATNAEQSDQRPLADWTRLLADGDDGAWRWFHARYYVTLLRYAAHRSGDVSAASEIVQQSYLRIRGDFKALGIPVDPDAPAFLPPLAAGKVVGRSRSWQRR